MLVMPFPEIRKEMFEQCGGKGAHLGELTGLGLNVPRGFVVLGDGYYQHLRENGIEAEIAALAGAIDFEDYEDMEGKTAAIRALIDEVGVPPEIAEEISEQYRRLCGEDGDRFVAVRSSVAIKGSSISSFPGLMDTFHYLKGEGIVVEYVRRCWSSVWSTRAAFTRHTKGLDHWRAIIAPVVQLMVDAEKAGVAFTVNPVSGEKDEILIESTWGLGEGVVSGECLCDLYVAAKKPFAIKNASVANKERAYVQKEGGGAGWVAVPKNKAKERSLSDEDIERICSVACLIEDHYQYPQDLEWAFEGQQLCILQARRAKTASE